MNLTMPAKRGKMFCTQLFDLCNRAQVNNFCDLYFNASGGTGCGYTRKVNHGFADISSAILNLICQK